MIVQSGSDWQLEHLRLLKPILVAQQEKAKQFWERMRWLQWLTLPAYLGWLGIWLLAYRSEEIWQAMWIVKTAPSLATRRQKYLAFFALPRLRQFAAMHLWWLQHGNYFRWVVCTAVVGSMFVYAAIAFVLCVTYGSWMVG